MLVWPPKDPNEDDDYDLDWTDRLAGDIITSSAWSPPPDSSLVITSSSNSDTETKVWLSGGIAETQYVLLNTVTTTGGRTLVEAVTFLCDLRQSS